MRYLFSFLIFLGFSVQSAIADQTKTVSFYDESLSLKIPQDFVVMSDEYKAIKYPGGNAPEFVYMDDTTKINVAVGKQFFQVEGFSADAFANAMWDSMKKIRVTNEVHKVGSQIVNGIELGVIEFTTPALESDDYGIYNSMSFVLDEDVFYIISFNCTTDLASRCIELGKIIRESIYLVN